MDRVITIRIPDWVGDDFVKRVERLLERRDREGLFLRKSGQRDVPPLR